MFRRLKGNALTMLSLASFALFLSHAAAVAQEPCASCSTGCATCAPGHCQHFHCPPALKWCAEGKPRICFQHGCAKPVCCPCDNPNWGYFQKCWSPWPWPPDFSHCPVPTPASQVYPGMIPAGQASQILDGPPPRRVEVH